MERMKKYKPIAAAIGILVLIAVLFPVLSTHANPDELIRWEKAAKENEVAVYLSLPGNAGLDEASTLKVGFYLNGEDIEDAVFLFEKDLTEGAEVVVKEYLYDEEAHLLTVFLSGRGKLIQKGEALKLGRIQILSDDNVEITVAADSCSMVDQYHDMEKITEFGDVVPYTMILKESDVTDPAKPETSEPEEGETEDKGEPEETTKPEETMKPEETTARAGKEDDGEDSGKSGLSQNWSVNDGSWKYKKPDGSYAKDEWVMEGGKWYYFNAENTMQTGWISVNQTWYYLNPSGEMKTGWVWDGRKWYYCSSSGAMKTGWVQDKTIWYHLDPSGAMSSGWVQDNNKWYYMDQDGKMMTSTVTPDGYHLDRNGICIEK